MSAHRFGLATVAPAELRLSILGFFACAACGTASAWGAPLAIPGQVFNNTPSVTIGTLSVTTGNPNSNSISATFTLNDQFRNVMSDANGDQFRFFQVITYDDEPVKWNGNIISPASTANNTQDVVDIPAGGWDYERTATTSGGDNSPFYENDTTNDPVSGLPYYYPGYVTEHSADGVNPGTSKTYDAPGIGTVGDQTLFATYIAYESPALLADKEVDILGGYTWGVTKTALNGVVSTVGTNIAYADIGAGALLQLGDALNISGYSDWSIISNDAILNTLAPEPSSLTLGALAALLGGAFGLRRRFAKRAVAA